MSSVFKLKRNDTSPAILYQLDRAVNLGSATVVFNMKEPDGTIVVNRAAGSVHSSDPPVLRYDWDAADSATKGAFLAEFEVTYADGSVETWPNEDFIEVAIDEDIA
jgi:hypothetical protein